MQQGKNLRSEGSSQARKSKTLTQRTMASLLLQSLEHTSHGMKDYASSPPASLPCSKYSRMKALFDPTSQGLWKTHLEQFVLQPTFLWLIASQISKLDNQSSWFARTGTLQETKLKTKFKLQLNYNKIMITTELIFNINFEPTLMII